MIRARPVCLPPLTFVSHTLVEHIQQILLLVPYNVANRMDSIYCPIAKPLNKRCRISSSVTPSRSLFLVSQPIPAYLSNGSASASPASFSSSKSPLASGLNK